MLKLIRYLLRTSITPFLLVLVVVPAYYFKLIHSQTTFIIFLLIGGIAGQVIQYHVQQYHNKKNGIEKKKKKIEIEEKVDPLSTLPKEIQDLIKEGESLEQGEEGMKQEANKIV